jgi:hypothetical protein
VDLAELPPARLVRWNAHRKAAVVIALRSGKLTRSEAYDRYLLSEEELSDWETTFEQDGLAGLQLKYR